MLPDQNCIGRLLSTTVNLGGGESSDISHWQWRVRTAVREAGPVSARKLCLSTSCISVVSWGQS